MLQKLNCWEFMNCGRESDGLMVPILGECPVSKYMKYDGLNNGVGAGRACWMVSCSFLCFNNHKRSNCCNCIFYKRVIHEEAGNACFIYSSLNA